MAVPLPQEERRTLTSARQPATWSPLRAWFKWLASSNHILYNPASELELPRLEHRLPKYVLTATEADMVIIQPTWTRPWASATGPSWRRCTRTGMRRMELLV